MTNKFRLKLFSKELPLWFRILNLVGILLPVLLWPLIFFTTIFFFDNPKTIAAAFFYFVVVNAYPVYLIIIAHFNCILFQKNRLLGLILPIAILATCIIGGGYYYYSVKKITEEHLQQQEVRKEQGFLDADDEFKILNGKVYRHDTLLVDADAKTFETVSWDWQKDKNHYYRFGKMIPTIDRQSFEFLDYSYAKDKNHVYYDENIIEGADVKTFYHIEGSQDGKDATNCYRRGEKVDCKVLLHGE